MTDSDPLKGFQHFVEIIPQRIQDVLKEIGCVCVAEEFKRHLRMSVPIIIKPYFGGNTHCDVSITARYCFMLKLFFLFMLTQLFPSFSQKLIETQSPKLTHHHLSSFISVLFFFSLFMRCTNSSASRVRRLTTAQCCLSNIWTLFVYIFHTLPAQKIKRVQSHILRRIHTKNTQIHNDI